VFSVIFLYFFLFLILVFASLILNYFICELQACFVQLFAPIYFSSGFLFLYSASYLVSYVLFKFNLFFILNICRVSVLVIACYLVDKKELCDD